MSWNVHICTFGDFAMVREAVDSVPNGVPIHVCDGRYASFDGRTDVTPGLETWCEDIDQVHYHAPSPTRLPFGHDLDAVPRARPCVHAKAQWMIHEVLPQDEWTLKLDSDERLERFDVDLTTLDEWTKYVPLVEMADGSGRVNVARLFMPAHWTAWIDDCLLPRSDYARTSSPEWMGLVYEQGDVGFVNRERLPWQIRITNHGDERSLAYQRRRADHLEWMGRETRAEAVRDRLDQADQAFE